MAEDTIEIRLFGTEKAIAGLKLRAGSVERGARIAMNGVTLRILNRIKRSFGEPGKPQRRTGHLSRSIIRLVADESGVIKGVVGSTLPYKTGYAAILEKGGPLPAMTIAPKKAKALRWFTGFRGIAFQAALQAGSTVKGAIKAARAGHLGRGRGGRRADVAFARSVKIPARYQRAMPYMRPGFEAERPLIPNAFKKEIRKQLGLEEISAGLGEG
jgi:hypothetical protein